MKDIINLNDCPVVIAANYVTGDNSGYSGSQYVGSYSSMEELNDDMSKLIAGIPSLHWRLEFSFQDAE